MYLRVRRRRRGRHRRHLSVSAPWVFVHFVSALLLIASLARVHWFSCMTVLVIAVVHVLSSTISDTFKCSHWPESNMVADAYLSTTLLICHASVLVSASAERPSSTMSGKYSGMSSLIKP
jgi:hypothetical protein